MFPRHACYALLFASVLTSAVEDPEGSCSREGTPTNSARLMQLGTAARHDASLLRQPSLLRTSPAKKWTTWAMIDANYLHMFDCWAETFLSSQTQQPIHVSCLDFTTLVHVDAWKLALGTAGLEVSSGEVPQAEGTAFLQTGEDMQASMPKKSYVKQYYPELQALLQKTGGDVLHSDTDAMWLGSPDSLLNDVLKNFPDADLVSSRHREPVPMVALKAWGFVVNTGFTLFRHTEAMHELLQEISSSVSDLDDQSHLHLALLKRGCSWQTKENLEDAYSQKEHHGGDEAFLIGRCGNLRLVLLPPAQISRAAAWNHESFDSSKVLVWHPDLPGSNASDRLDIFRSANVCT